MKKQLLSLLIAGAALSAQAQKADSVLIGNGYPDEIWYSLENDEQGKMAKDNWDLAFDVIGITSSIHVNTAAGAMLWGYPKGDKSAWSSVDTSGLSTWDARYNSDTSWAVGAMGRYADPSNPFDLDWGSYDMATHKVTGDSLYIIKLVNGNYKKLFIESLSGGEFKFKFANLDGSSEKTGSVNKSQFTDKNMGYYSISGEKAVMREPDMQDWDLVFTKYTGFVTMGGPSPVPYGVTGILQNRGVKVAKAANLSNKNSYNNYHAHTFMSEINTIGYDWKSYNMGTSSYDIQDSLVYFVSVPDAETNTDAIWKIIFTDFASSDGKFVFNKSRIVAATVNELGSDKKITLALAPNPSNGQDVQIVYNIESNNDAVMLNVTDLTGKTIMVRELNNQPGLHTYALPASTFSSGMYIVSVHTRGGSVQQKLIVQ